MFHQKFAEELRLADAAYLNHCRKVEVMQKMEEARLAQQYQQQRVSDANLYKMQTDDIVNAQRNAAIERNGLLLNEIKGKKPNLRSFQPVRKVVDPEFGTVLPDDATLPVDAQQLVDQWRRTYNSPAPLSEDVQRQRHERNQEFQRIREIARRSHGERESGNHKLIPIPEDTLPSEPQPRQSSAKKSGQQPRQSPAKNSELDAHLREHLNARRVEHDFPEPMDTRMAYPYMHARW